VRREYDGTACTTVQVVVMLRLLPVFGNFLSYGGKRELIIDFISSHCKQHTSYTKVNVWMKAISGAFCVGEKGSWTKARF